MAGRESMWSVQGSPNSSWARKPPSGGGGSPAFRLRDGSTPLAAGGSALHNALHVTMPAAGRRWSIAVEGSSLTPIQVALPWLILVFERAG